MSTHLQPRLNRLFVLRYDTPHELVPVGEDDDRDLAEIVDLLAGGSDHMDVNGISGVGPTQPLYAPRGVQGVDTPAAANALAPQDELRISPEARQLDELSRTAALRQERIAQIQQEIADGTYDTPELMDKALDRFLEKYGLSDE